MQQEKQDRDVSNQGLYALETSQDDKKELNQRHESFLLSDSLSFTLELENIVALDRDLHLNDSVKLLSIAQRIFDR